ncbi:zinc finger protein 8-like [Cynara cardunculus var. scolymus]|uniref:zinc finger protein 8-like n=1 Tax=Cynara cardunculus var. scolymus TaxID=59895 RepID=UPI000D6302F5|nr:zinc finger protein 8-like [Cynara cardunculus var. scolymus]
MEESGAETHDFMNIESFSQLRFIPHLPPKKNSIRLFGKEFGGSDPTTIITDEFSSADDSTATVIHHETKDNGESRRKFECHYCCRDFQTSQALGGHQNAHRRERLHAKRTHIHSVMIHGSSAVNHHHHHVTTTSTPSYQHHHHQSTNCITNNGTSIRFQEKITSYTSHQTRAIAGRPFASTAVRSSTDFNGGGGLLNSSGAGSCSPILYMHESRSSFYDQVSLDLHL